MQSGIFINYTHTPTLKLAHTFSPTHKSLSPRTHRCSSRCRAFIGDSCKLHTHTHSHKHIHTNVHTHTHTQMQHQMQGMQSGMVVKCTHIRTVIYTHSLSHTQVHTHTHTQMQQQMQGMQSGMVAHCTHTHTLIHKHSCSHTHVYKHTQHTDAAADAGLAVGDGCELGRCKSSCTLGGAGHRCQPSCSRRRSRRRRRLCCCHVCCSRHIVCPGSKGCCPSACSAAQKTGCATEYFSSVGARCCFWCGSTVGTCGTSGSASNAGSTCSDACMFIAFCSCGYWHHSRWSGPVCVGGANARGPGEHDR